jgi:hypothetical protein
LCFPSYSVAWGFDFDSIAVRYTLVSDSINNNKEGWLIDNMLIHATTVHTVKKIDSENIFSIYPNPANNIIYLVAQKTFSNSIIEVMELVNSEGKIVDTWKNITTQFTIDTTPYSNGNYYLNIATSSKKETIALVIRKH